MGYRLAHHGRTARTLFNLLPPSKRGLVRRGKGGHQSSYPLVHGRIKTFTSKITGVWAAQWWEDGAFKRVRGLVVYWRNLPCFIPGGRIMPNKKYGGAVYAVGG